MKPMVYVEGHRDALVGPDLPPTEDQRIYTAEEFEALTEREPQHDDLDRLNCPDAGLIGHLLCGACVVHQMPRHMCGCVAPHGVPTDRLPAMRVVTDPEWDHARVAVDLERIMGWPGLEAFPVVMQRLRGQIGNPNTCALRDEMEAWVTYLFMELISRGALVRDLMRGGAWRYDGRGRRVA